MMKQLGAAAAVSTLAIVLLAAGCGSAGAASATTPTTSAAITPAPTATTLTTTSATPTTTLPPTTTITTPVTSTPAPSTTPPTSVSTIPVTTEPVTSEPVYTIRANTGGVDDMYATVHVGTTVRWMPAGEETLTLVSDTPGLFGGILTSGTSVEYTFNEVGVYYYHFAEIDGFEGSVTVIP